MKALKYQKSGELMQIQIYSLSSTNANAIIYDDNEAFAFLYLNKLPKDDTLFSVVYDNPSTKNDFDARNTVFLDTTINYDMNTETDSNMRLIYVISDSNFVFEGDCFSATK